MAYENYAETILQAFANHLFPKFTMSMRNKIKHFCEYLDNKNLNQVSKQLILLINSRIVTREDTLFNAACFKKDLISDISSFRDQHLKYLSQSIPPANSTGLQ